MWPQLQNPIIKATKNTTIADHRTDIGLYRSDRQLRPIHWANTRSPINCLSICLHFSPDYMKTSWVALIQGWRWFGSVCEANTTDGEADCLGGSNLLLPECTQSIWRRSQCQSMPLHWTSKLKHISKHYLYLSFERKFQLNISQIVCCALISRRRGPSPRITSNSFISLTFSQNSKIGFRTQRE